jgi:eukaryotic-like serine/threonine-protein kinase
MEFVEGETLESLIIRSGRLEVKLALEIAQQVAAGLAAVHKENLVHRDIKPSNIMVSLERGGDRTAKIIDLGLAKTVGGSDLESVISVAGDLPAPRNLPVRNNLRDWGSIFVRISIPWG